uniref:HECT-type E3 ubiquitin transferase n=1 Tax=Mucochytrium quahogii TaxID=96639 RepID=A0A7S2WR58_9STRA|mmetsp:Transcript_7356/g.15994  ORF Transcript_7356/g.15994 Transcript_7356/m.15994 type:complete len:1003 (+) Transcript_7356:80-3088(+)|eukprot:CAMPEP_0203750502 /NCGR_PEP_ID=MMETSP0098-20131031/4719_1 /ASSEMBLY_ACC=CAM_ASM_000208 /TAXON_ID=96639 /ORGANISM=" , Strain NY0313808BC1" /LENGTH=1002 /DNA_ID=CAMNT_0050639819 /DNA_START=35 /DNA_END=3043 /DNA_ORIENTATION=-
MFDDGERRGSRARDVVAQARKEREQRQIDRERRKFVVVIQSSVRGWMARRNTIHAMRLDFEKKIVDVNNVVNVLQQVGQVFVVPVGMLHGLIRQFVFCFGEQDENACRFICELVFGVFNSDTRSELFQPTSLVWKLRMTRLNRILIYAGCRFGDNALFFKVVEGLDLVGAVSLYIDAVQNYYRIPCEEELYSTERKESFSRGFSTIARSAPPEKLLPLLSIPLLTYRLKEDTLRELGMKNLTPALRSGVLRLSATSIPVEYWLLGNLAVLTWSFRKDDVEWVVFSLEKMQQLVANLISNKTFSGAMSVVWIDKENCCALPGLLKSQYQFLNSVDFCRDICKRCLFVSDGFIKDRRQKHSLLWESKKAELEDKRKTEPSLQAATQKSLLERAKDMVPSWAWVKNKVAKKDPPQPLRNESEASRRYASGVVSATNARSGIDFERAIICTRFFATFIWLWPPSGVNHFSINLMNSLSFCMKNLAEALWIIYDESVGKEVDTLVVFCAVAQHVLVVTDDEELYEHHCPLHLYDIEQIIILLKNLGFKALMRKPKPEGLEKALVDRSILLLGALYERQSRRALCVTKTWLVESLAYKNGIQNVSPEQRDTIVRDMPYTIPFSERVALFQEMVRADRCLHQPRNEPPRIRFKVRRESVFEDGFRNMNQLGSALKGRVYVVFVNAAGQEESGIDAGGLFKEFWTTLSGVAFNPNYGLFNTTADQLLYPNPQSQLAHGRDHLLLYEFLGCIVGKALYEDIVIQPQFARFFLSKFLNQYSFIGDLPSLDIELYKNLCFLKTFQGDIRDLCLTFSISENDFGQQNEVELTPGGRDIAVTPRNKFRYVNLVANYHLNVKGSAQTMAFLRGFSKLIQPEWIRMFTQPELQTLISGQLGKLDVDDWKKHTKYANGFLGMDRTITRFWRVVEQLSDDERALLLKFVTSCERPPLLGFVSLQPPFCIHKIPISNDDEKLPTASTCFNQLKLPTYSSAKVMKQKLLMSITSGTGFELS